MGKLLKILGIVFVVLVLGFLGLLWWGHAKGASTQEAFYRAVLSGDPQQVLARLHPEVAKQVDRPILEAWMAAVKRNLGSYKGLAGSKFSTATSSRNGHDYVTTSGRVEFELGSAASELELRDGKIVRFHLASERMPKDWLQALPDLSFYEAAGKAWLERLLQGDAQAAYGEMHENLRAKLSFEEMQTALARVLDIVGSIGSITPSKGTFTPAPGGDAGKPPEIVLHYALAGAKRPAEARVRYQVLDLAAHLLGFDVRPR